MSWNKGGDGNGTAGGGGSPWGQPGGKKPENKPFGGGNPWMRKPQESSGGGGGPAMGGPMPPEIEEALKKIQSALGPFKPKGHGQAIVLALAVLTGLWLLSGIYQVAADQVGVVMRFGAFARTEMPGLRYHLPQPIEDVRLVVVTAQNEIPIGFQHVGRHGKEDGPGENLMLTQDENMINVEFTVFWRVGEVGDFLFEIRDPKTTIKMAAESVMREVIGQNKLQFVLTDGRGQVAEEARARLQELLDKYKTGVVISQINLQTVSVPDEVKDAFQDVVNARLDQERFQNQAAAHVNKVIPDAKGQAAQMVQQAMAYRDQKIALAQGEADRFKSVLAAYATAREVTSRRLYLETMEQILGHAHKVIVDKGASGGAVPYFPLSDLRGKMTGEGGKP